MIRLAMALKSPSFMKRSPLQLSWSVGAKRERQRDRPDIPIRGERKGIGRYDGEKRYLHRLSAAEGCEAMGKTMPGFGGNTFALFTRNPRGGSVNRKAHKRRNAVHDI